MIGSPIKKLSARWREVGILQMSNSLFFVSIARKDPVVILDPVNVGNNVAGRLSDGERQEIVRAATAAWEKLETASWKDEKGATLDLWKEIMGRSFTVDED